MIKSKGCEEQSINSDYNDNNYFCLEFTQDTSNSNKNSDKISMHSTLTLSPNTNDNSITLGKKRLFEIRKDLKKLSVNLIKLPKIYSNAAIEFKDIDVIFLLILSKFRKKLVNHLPKYNLTKVSVKPNKQYAKMIMKMNYFQYLKFEIGVHEDKFFDNQIINELKEKRIDEFFREYRKNELINELSKHYSSDLDPIRFYCSIVIAKGFFHYIYNDKNKVYFNKIINELDDDLDKDFIKDCHKKLIDFLNIPQNKKGRRSKNYLELEKEKKIINLKTMSIEQLNEIKKKIIKEYHGFS